MTPEVTYFFMLNSIERGISTDHTVKTTCKILKITIFLALKLSAVVFILLINVKMPTIVGIFNNREQDKLHAQMSPA